MRGRLITLEGIDGTGKSTVASKLAKLFSKDYHRGSRLDLATSTDRHFVFTAEPTNGEIGRLLRRHHLREKPQIGIKDEKTSELEGMQELLLFMADHAYHLAATVMPALLRGSVVISDRYTDSRVAYQGAILRNIVPEPIKWIRELHQPWSINPDLTLLFTMDAALAVQRCQSRSSPTSDLSPAKYPCDESNTGWEQQERKGLEWTGALPVQAKFEQEEFLRRVQKIFEEIASLEPDRFVAIDANRPVDDVVEAVFSTISEFLSR